MRRSLLLPCLPLFIVACTDHAGPSARSELSPSPLFQQSSGQGAVVLRYTAALGFQFGVTDFDQNLTALWGFTLEQHLASCSDPGSVTFEPIEFLEVHRKDGSLKVSLTSEEVPVVIWGAADFDICGSLLQAPVVATGTIERFIYTDRDLSGTSPAAESFGVRGHGRVTLAETGEVSNLNAFFHITFTPTGIFQVADRLTFSHGGE
jgi:hypothetical protein